MYAQVRPPTDAPSSARRYVDQVEQNGLSAQLTQLQARFRRVDPWTIDLVLGTVFVVVGLLALFAPDTMDRFREPDGWAVFLTVSAAAPYYLRRRAPLPVLVVTAIPVVILAIAGYPT